MSEHSHSAASCYFSEFLGLCMRHRTSLFAEMDHKRQSWIFYTWYSLNDSFTECNSVLPLARRLQPYHPRWNCSHQTRQTIHQKPAPLHTRSQCLGSHHLYEPTTPSCILRNGHSPCTVPTDVGCDSCYIVLCRCLIGRASLGGTGTVVPKMRKWDRHTMEVGMILIFIVVWYDMIWYEMIWYDMIWNDIYIAPFDQKDTKRFRGKKEGKGDERGHSFSWKGLSWWWIWSWQGGCSIDVEQKKRRLCNCSTLHHNLDLIYHLFEWGRLHCFMSFATSKMNQITVNQQISWIHVKLKVVRNLVCRNICIIRLFVGAKLDIRTAFKVKLIDSLSVCQGLLMNDT